MNWDPSVWSERRENLAFPAFPVILEDKGRRVLLDSLGSPGQTERREPGVWGAKLDHEDREDQRDPEDREGQGGVPVNPEPREPQEVTDPTDH